MLREGQMGHTLKKDRVMGNSLGTEQIREYCLKDLPCLQIELMLFGLN